jgi:hypothetical protein
MPLLGSAAACRLHRPLGGGKGALLIAPAFYDILRILVLLASSLTLLSVFLLSSGRIRLWLAGLFIILSLALPPYLVVERAGPALKSLFTVLLDGYRSSTPLPWWGNLLSTLVYLLPSIVFSVGLIMLALLLASSLRGNPEQENAGAAAAQPDQALPQGVDRRAGVYLLLSGLVLVATLYNLFWLVVWDNTTDEFSIFWLFFTLPFVLLCGLFLQRRSKPSAAVFVLLSLGLFAGVFALAARVDYRALTESRAGRVSRAIEAYQARTGRYPQDLGQLAPRYLLSLPGPVIINGMDWCYEPGETGYRLGYVDREHWSSPELFGHLSRIGGTAQDIPDLCADQIRAFKDLRGW